MDYDIIVKVSTLPKIKQFSIQSCIIDSIVNMITLFITRILLRCSESSFQDGM
jgi:hypothetical protein